MSLEPIGGKALIHWGVLAALPKVREALGDDTRAAVSFRSHLMRVGAMKPTGEIDMQAAGRELPIWERAFSAIYGDREQRRRAPLSPQAKGHATRRQQQTRQRPGWQPAGGYATGGEP